MVCGHVAEMLQARFRIVCLCFFVSLVLLGIFIIVLDAGQWRVLLTSAEDVKLGGITLECRSRTENELGKLKEWFGK